MLNIRYNEVKIWHFSTDQKPCDFLFKTGTPHYKEFIDGFLAARPRKQPEGKQAEIDKRVKLAFQDWYDAYQKAWTDMVESFIPKEGTRCVFCKREQSAYHILLECPRTQAQRENWRAAANYPKSEIVKVVHFMDPLPGFVGAAMQFLGAVRKLQQKHSIEGKNSWAPKKTKNIDKQRESTIVLPCSSCLLLVLL